MHKKAAMLEDRGIISVSGEDATSFLQGLLTNDVERLGPSEARYGALLTPQGKILFDMIVVRAASSEAPSYLIDCTATQAADLAKRLGFYKLRAKVAVADVSADRAVAAFWGDELRVSPKAFFTPTRAIHAWGGARSCRGRLPPRSDPSTGANTKAFASRSGRPRVASISPMRTPSRTTPISIFSMGSISTRAATSARRSFRA